MYFFSFFIYLSAAVAAITQVNTATGVSREFYDCSKMMNNESGASENHRRTPHTSCGKCSIENFKKMLGKDFSQFLGKIENRPQLHLF